MPNCWERGELPAAKMKRKQDKAHPVTENPGRNAKRVLVIRLGAQEPFIVALAAVQALRQAHPQARIDLLTGPAYKAFAEACPYFDRVDAGGIAGDGKARKALAARIHSQNYDIIYDFETGDLTAKLYARLRRQGGRAALWSGTAPHCPLPHDRAGREDMPACERFADQLHQAGIRDLQDVDAGALPAPDLGWIFPVLGNPPRLQTAYFSLGSPFMLYAPVQSAAHRSLRWPMERHVELVRRIAEAGVQPVLVGGPDERAIGQEVAREVSEAKNLVGRTDLFQTASLGRAALFMVGAALEPANMAASFATPSVVTLSTRHNDPDRDRPQGALSIVIHGETLRKIATDDVWRAIEAMGILPGRASNP